MLLSDQQNEIKMKTFKWKPRRRNENLPTHVALAPIAGALHNNNDDTDRKREE